MPRKISARRRLLPGNGSKYIKHCEAEIKPGDRVVLVCRESRRRRSIHTTDCACVERAAPRRPSVGGPFFGGRDLLNGD